MNSGVLRQVVQGRDVALGQIHHMYVVANASAIRCVVVLAVHVEFTQLAHGDLRDKRHQVVGDAIGILTDQTR